MKELPHRDLDPVLTLFSHYFQVAELMLEDFTQLEARIRKLKNPRRHGWKLVIYHNVWLGFLAVTCEGWKKINMRQLLNQERPVLFGELTQLADAINSTMKRHADPLRKYRNSVMHLRTDTKDLLEFLGGPGNKRGWAEQLHGDLKRFFSEYRILCATYYLLNDQYDDEKFG